MIDPGVRVWRYVKGAEDLPKMHDTQGSRKADQSGKLASFLNLDENRETKILCIDYRGCIGKATTPKIDLEKKFCGLILC